MKVTIKGFNAVAEWTWDLPPDADNTCGICQVNFEATCAKCKYPGEECPIVVGECRHCFHMHCIADWLVSEAAQNRCPMCRQPFRERVADAAAAMAAPATPQRQNAPGAALTPRTPASTGARSRG